MASTKSAASADQGAAAPLKDPVARNEAALDSGNLKAELQASVTLRKGLDAALQREIARRKGLEAELERERDLRGRSEAELQKATQMIDSLNADRELRDQRPSRRKRHFRGRQTL